MDPGHSKLAGSGCGLNVMVWAWGATKFFPAKQYLNQVAVKFVADSLPTHIMPVKSLLQQFFKPCQIVGSEMEPDPV